MRILSTTVIRTVTAVVVLLGGFSVYGQNCTQGKGLTSNNVRWLIGSGDTLWMVTERGQELTLNLIESETALDSSTVTDEGNWKHFTLGCRKVGINDLFLDNGLTVASFDTAPTVIWTYDHETEKTRDRTFSWPTDSSNFTFTVNDIAGIGGGYWLACRDGGLMGWDPGRDMKTVFFPGIDSGYEQPSILMEHFPPHDTTRQVTGVEPFSGDSLLLVTSPSRLWLFSTVDSSWDSSITTELSGSAVAEPVFEYPFVNRIDPSHPLYCIISDADADKDADAQSVLYKYNRGNHRWEPMFEEAPKALTFCHNGYFYALFDDMSLRNIIRLYRDTLGDSGVVLNPKPVADDAVLHSRMTGTQDIDVPAIFNDVLYAPRNDSTGYLWVATSEGLFLSPEEAPGSRGNDTVPFILIKRAPSVSAGLKKTYARPGILTPAASNCKFIYNIEADRADVTIKIFDYNMDHVKTVIEKRPRISGKQGGPLGRSTVESEDNWDGTNEQRRPVAPGVYYYKITTSSGERAFGKIVVAR
ncbi:MAG: hypothetical protein JW863_01635 [Chitinispirillaceae bacterium]|nr:hypothetical protein [Chitinispirillaceae bacterium]